MTYEQSLKNIEKIKDLILPLESHQIFFDFSNNTDFRIVLIKNSEFESESESISDLVRSKFKSELPLGKIYHTELDHELLHYEDGLTCYQYNYTTAKVIMNDQKKGYKRRSPTERAIEMHKLLLKLKNM